MKFTTEYSHLISRNILYRADAKFLIDVKFKPTIQKTKVGASHTLKAATPDINIKASDTTYKIIASQISPDSAVSLINRFIAITQQPTLPMLKKFISSIPDVKPVIRDNLDLHLRALTTDKYDKIIDIDGTDRTRNIIENIFTKAKIITKSMEEYVRDAEKSDLLIFNNCLHHYDADTLRSIKINATNVLICELDINTPEQANHANFAHNVYAYVIKGDTEPTQMNYMKKVDVIALFKKKVIGDSQPSINNNLLNEYAIILS
jgi:hypothetical protein